MKWWYKILVALLIFLGFLQTLAVIRGNVFLYMLAKSTGASPMNAAFNALNGVEFWALKHKVYVETDLDEKKEIQLTADFVRQLDYPYFVRITYASPFGFSEIHPVDLSKAVIKKYLCKDPKVKQSLGVKGNLKFLKIVNEEKMNKDKIHEMSEHCD